MLKALYDYGIRNHLTIPPGFLKKNIRAYSACPIAGDFWGSSSAEKRKHKSVRILARLQTVRISAIHWLKRSLWFLASPGKNRITFVCF